MTPRRSWPAGTEAVPAGLMLPLLRPGPGEDQAFNSWYDEEHAPARAALPGFLTARRWRSVPGWVGSPVIDPVREAADLAEPLHYAATFDLDDLAVLDGAEYLGLR